MGYDFLVVGAGIVGLTIALELKKSFGGSVCVIDKENRIGAHGSGRNSGVLHAGIYYKPGTLKARLCVSGNRLMREYCEEKGIRGIKGKVIVTKNEREVETLLELEKRARANGADVKIVDEKELREIEPYARTVHRALYSPNTVVIDPQEVLARLLEDAAACGIEVRFGVKLAALDQKEAVTTAGRIGYGFLVNAAGAYADRIAHMCGLGKNYTMLPYKGIYLRVKEGYEFLVRANIYPVPDIRFPFLGVHFTRTPHGVVKMGPTAIPALSRENYGLLENIRCSELRETLLYNARQFATNKNYVLMGFKEIGKYIPYVMYKDARQLVPSLKYSYISRYPLVGIRAQLFDRTKNELVMDYLILKGDNSIHILNAVSPAFTSSLAFAQYVVNLYFYGTGSRASVKPGL
ncbi:MAG: L-2-hydroxyglutarate oxidase [Thermoanaerobacteraceae bacterium]|nr:L-2-hydroxyglutarate oxidase [Thermoanaerobacteraceae bacterium]